MRSAQSRVCRSRASPLNPAGSAITAGRVLVQRIHAFARAGESFAFETTCAGRGHARLLRTCRAAGYRITLIYLWLPSSKHALDRIALRVQGGGHSVPDDVVIRRYRAGLQNMRRLYLPLADIGLIYDNSTPARVLIAEMGPAVDIIHDQARWSQIERATT